MAFYEDILTEQNTYFSNYSKSRNDFLKYSDSRMKAISHDLENVRISIEKTKSECYEIDSVIEQNEKSKDERIALIKKNIKSLKKLFFVEKVSLDGGKLSVVTKPVIIEGYNFNRFVISIHPRNYPSHFKAKSYKNYLRRHKNPLYSEYRRYYYHPHVASNGDVCLGDFTNLVEKLMRNFEFESVFTTIWEILTTYNPDSSYKPIKTLVEIYNIEHYDTKTNKTV